MAMSISANIELQVLPSKLWEILTACDDFLAKLIPDVFASIEYIEGDGNVGTVRLIKFGPAADAHSITFVKEKLEIRDDATKTLTYSVIEGEILNFFKSYKATVTIAEGADPSSCTVDWTLEYELLNADGAFQELAKAGTVRIFKSIEAYLLASPPP
eukprot:c6129_g1_i1 orf=213-683(+)